MVETAEQERIFYTTETTPSGIEIRYQPSPKRQYWMRRASTWKDFAEGENNWQPAPSVTQILDCLDKPGLPWWGMKVGAEGVLELFDKGALYARSYAKNYGTRHVVCVSGQSSDIVASLDDVTQLLTEHKLTVNHVRDRAGDRGANVHTALERWAATGELPVPSDYPEEESGYVLGLLKFLQDAAIEPVRQEVMVGSIEHSYAGRYDNLARVTSPSRVVTKVYPKKAPLYTTMPVGLGLFDLKTSADVYPTHMLQLEAYEAASAECGYEPTDWRVVLHVTKDGKYEVVRSSCAFADFLAVKGAYDAVQRAKEAIKR